MPLNEQDNAVLEQLDSIAAERTGEQSDTIPDVADEKPTDDAVSEGKPSGDEKESDDTSTEKETPDSEGGDESGGEAEAQDKEEAAALLAKAESYGITKEKMESWGDNAKAMVDDIAAAIDEKTLEFGRALANQQQVTPEQKPSKTEPKDNDDHNESSIAQALLDDGYDESDPVYKAMKALEDKNAALEAQVQQAAKSGTQGSNPQAEANRQQAIADINGFFSTVPEQLQKELWGGGNILDVDPNSANYVFVDKVLETMKALDIGYEAQGQQLPLKDLAERAFTMMAKDKLRALHDKNVSEKLKKRERSFTEAPAKRNRNVNDREPKDRDESVDELAQTMREHGFL